MGYANVDNLAFDVLANLWGVTDMTTGAHNAVGDGPSPSALPVNHSGVGSAADAGGNLVGVFGNNWMLFITTSGPFASMHLPFAIGPTRCEMTGPTFVGNTLVLSVQHPGEDSPTRAALAANLTFLRTGLEILTLDGSGVFSQDRAVPVGSQWPGNIARDPTDVALCPANIVHHRHATFASTRYRTLDTVPAAAAERSSPRHVHGWGSATGAASTKWISSVQMNSTRGRRRCIPCLIAKASVCSAAGGPSLWWRLGAVMSRAMRM
jgi:Bacterial protein of unknown function (DUF839)